MQANKTNSLQIQNRQTLTLLLPTAPITADSIEIPDDAGVGVTEKSYTNTTGSLVQVIADEIISFTRGDTTVLVADFATITLNTILLSQGDTVVVTNPSTAVAIPFWMPSY